MIVSSAYEKNQNLVLFDLDTSEILLDKVRQWQISYRRAITYWFQNTTELTHNNPPDQHFEALRWLCQISQTPYG